MVCRRVNDFTQRTSHVRAGVSSFLLLCTALSTLHAGQDSTPASGDYCKGISIEVNGIGYDGSLLTCQHIEKTNNGIQGTIGDGLWPPTDLQFPQIRRDATLQLVFATKPADDPHVDVYAWPLPPERDAQPQTCTNVASAERITWPVRLNPGKYVVVVTSHWEGGHKATRAFGMEVIDR